MTRSIIITWVVGLFFSSISFGNQISWKQQMLRSLTTFQTLFENRYAPYQWKKEKYGWDLDKAVAEAREAIEAFDEEKHADDFLLEYQDDYQRIITTLFRATKDYHVGIVFDDTRTARLPFEIRGADVDGKRKYFIVYIDEDYKKKDTLSFSVGDEITHFDGKEIGEVVDKMKVILGGNTTETDQSLAERAVTYRRAGRGEDLPLNKSIRIKGIKKAKTKDGEAETFGQNVSWGASGDEFRPSLVDRTSTLSIPSLGSENSHLQVMASIDGLIDASNAKDDNKHALGARVGFFPKLGAPWVDPVRGLNRPSFKSAKDKDPELIGKALDDKGTQSASKEDPFDWYITEVEGKKIGYIRIPIYSLPGGDQQYQKHVKFFAALIQHMEEYTDALVIDEMNNPGGSVFYLYALVSTLSNSGQPVPAPQHRHVLTQSGFKECKGMLEKLEEAKSLEDQLKALGEEDGSAHGYPVDLNFVNFTSRYCKFIVAEWERVRGQADPGAGMLSAPYYLWGADEINPLQFRGRRTTYSKPILLLINELDFSGGDFFPATLQDATKHSKVMNVTVMGTRTAGAGGYIGVHTDPILEDLGINRFVVTLSASVRINDAGTTIENLGVTPDVPYTLTAEDYQKNFAPFAKAVKDQLKVLMGVESKAKPAGAWGGLFPFMFK